MDSSSWPGVVVSATSSGLVGADWALMLLLFAALLMAATSAAAETALTSVNRIKLRNLAEEGDVAAKRVIRLLERPQVFLSTILVASNVSIIIASTVSTILALRLFVDYGEIISTILLSLFVLIFCEITPKTAAVQAPERWARFLVGPVELLTVILRPVIVVLTFITSGIVRIFGGQPVRRGPFVTEEELRLLVEVGEEEGVLEEDEREMIHNVFELADTQVREIMVPRIDMVTVEADASVADAMDIIVQGGQSRIPVFEGTIDNIIGVLYAKDLLRVVASHQQPATVKSLVRPAYFVPESKRLDDLLRELQQQRVHMAIVVDEYGAVAGLATIEDVVEEIIGDIQDEYDKEEQLFEKLSDNEFIVDAKISIYDFNELLDADLTAESYETLGGFVYSQLDKIPTVGDVVHYKNLMFTVLSTKGRRVTKVKVVRHASNEGTGDDDHGDHPLPLSQPDQLPALPSPHDPPEAGAPHAGPQERDFERTPRAEQEQHDPEPDPPSLSGDRHLLRSRAQSARRHGHGTTTRRR